ncbi:MAG: alpha/beta fold hydrolase [Pirellulales bacterium]|nr:alpha/beta fold hydrolase [Pirellulales bacterium]
MKRRAIEVLRKMLLATVAWGLVASPGALAQQRDRVAPDPAEYTLTTRDGVQLRITYFPSDAGVDATTVVLLHDQGESRAVLRELALALQTPTDPQAHRRAVVTVDFRGHGDSKTALGYDDAPIELDATQFRQEDYENMVGFDMEAIRSFLVEQNDGKKLNLNKLSLAGCGMGATIAAIWAAQDWATPPLAVRKQGQDVKALALVSPAWSYKGLALNPALRQPDVRQRVSLLLAYGDQSRDATRDARNILRNVEKFHPEPPADEGVTRKTLFVYEYPTTLQGTALVTKSEFALAPKLDEFLALRVDRIDFPWVGRKVK